MGQSRLLFVSKVGRVMNPWP